MQLQRNIAKNIPISSVRWWRCHKRKTREYSRVTWIFNYFTLVNIKLFVGLLKSLFVESAPFQAFDYCVCYNWGAGCRKCTSRLQNLGITFLRNFVIIRGANGYISLMLLLNIRMTSPSSERWILEKSPISFLILKKNKILTVANEVLKHCNRGVSYEGVIVSFFLISFLLKSWLIFYSQAKEYILISFFMFNF